MPGSQVSQSFGSLAQRVRPVDNWRYRSTFEQAGQKPQILLGFRAERLRDLYGERPHAAGRAGFRALLDSEPDIEVVGEAADGAQAVRPVRQERPDVVLMDIRMPGVDGLAATREIAADPGLSGVRIVVLTTFELDEYVAEALCGGAAGFLLKSTEPAEPVRAVRVVAAGEGLLSPSVTRRVIEQFAVRAANPTAPRELVRLTDREREVVALVGTGLANHEIAARLGVSPATTKTHVSRAMIKLAARDRAQLVVFAYEAGLVRPGWLP